MNRRFLASLLGTSISFAAWAEPLWLGQTGAGFQERRNVQGDFRKTFASDTDNKGEEAHAGLADFRFF